MVKVKDLMSLWAGKVKDLMSLGRRRLGPGETRMVKVRDLARFGW